MCQIYNRIKVLDWNLVISLAKKNGRSRSTKVIARYWTNKALSLYFMVSNSENLPFCAYFIIKIRLRSETRIEAKARNKLSKGLYFSNLFITTLVDLKVEKGLFVKLKSNNNLSKILRLTKSSRCKSSNHDFSLGCSYFLGVSSNFLEDFGLFIWG